MSSTTAAPTLGHRPSPAPVLRLRTPTRRGWWAGAAVLTAWASLLVVVGLWEANGGVQALTDGTGSALITLGRLTGLLSADLLLLQLFAMARMPWVERSIGQDTILAWHRWLGFASVHLMLAHVLLTWLGYSAAAGTGVWAELWSLITTAPGMLIATAGTLALVMVAITSMRRARRKVRYESWHLLHLYAYLGAALALPHQLWTGADFLFSTWATVYWWSMWGAAVLAVLVWRVAVPLALSRRHRLVVSRVTHEVPDVVTLHLTGRRLAELEVAAGQFFVFRFRTGPGWTRGHPLSLSAAPTTSGLRVTIGTTGDDGARMSSITPGTRVMVEGPYGTLRPEVRTRPGMVLIGSGLGLAPLVALAQEAVLSGRQREPITLVRRVRSTAGQPFQADLDRLVAAGALRVVDLTGPRSRTGASWLPDHLGHVPATDAVRWLIGDLDRHDVFVCGAAGWTEELRHDLRAAGVPSSALHVERFTW